jgi:hypothetical protein
MVVYLFQTSSTGYLPHDQASIADLCPPFYQGAIPGSLENLKNLEHLDLSGNKLEGLFPPHWGLVIPN